MGERGTADYTKCPYMSWEYTCTPEKFGGIGLKNLALWNKASIAKLVWFVAMEKDVLWVKWVHQKYLKRLDWGAYQTPADCSWHWRNVVATKETFKLHMMQHGEWKWHQGT